MALDTRFVLGVRSGVYVSDAAPAGAQALEPETVVLEVGEAAAAGALSLQLSSTLPVTLRANQVLTFNAGTPAAVTVIVTEDTPVSNAASAVPVDAAEGDEGIGIPAAIDADSVAEWDQLYRVLGTSGSGLTVGESTNELNSVTYDTAQAMTWDESAITSKNWLMNRAGRFKPRDHAFQQVQLANLEGREVFVKRVLADEDGVPALIQKGRSQITGYSDDAPADGIVDASWTFTGQGRPTIIHITP